MLKYQYYNFFISNRNIFHSEITITSQRLCTSYFIMQECISWICLMHTHERTCSSCLLSHAGDLFYSSSECRFVQPIFCVLKLLFLSQTLNIVLYMQITVLMMSPLVVNLHFCDKETQDKFSCFIGNFISKDANVTKYQAQNNHISMFLISFHCILSK